jgi:hypothetical protein
MFNAICVSTGKSASATLIHWALQPVAISEMLRTTDSRILVIEFDFMSVFCLEFSDGLNRRQRSVARRMARAAITTWSMSLQKQNRHQPKPMAIVFIEN